MKKTWASHKCNVTVLAQSAKRQLGMLAWMIWRGAFSSFWGRNTATEAQFSVSRVAQPTSWTVNAKQCSRNSVNDVVHQFMLRGRQGENQPARALHLHSHVHGNEMRRASKDKHMSMGQCRFHTQYVNRNCYNQMYTHARARRGSNSSSSKAEWGVYFLKIEILIERIMQSLY